MVARKQTARNIIIDSAAAAPHISIVRPGTLQCYNISLSRASSVSTDARRARPRQISRVDFRQK